MPVTVEPSPHGPRSWTGRKFRQASSPEALLAHTLTDEAAPPPGLRSASSAAAATTAARQLIQSSFAGLRRDDRVYATKNGFVHACMEAYNEHHRLVIRPEDVWFAILTQLGCYVNAHAEELRDILLVSDDDDDDTDTESENSDNSSDNDNNHSAPHDQGVLSGSVGGGRSSGRDRGDPQRQQQQQQQQQKQRKRQHLHIEADLSGGMGTGTGIDHGRMAHAMTKLMQRRFRDGEDLRAWVQPAFTTTTKVDQAVASVVFMGAMQRYFTYSWGTRCGIPSATLLGLESDWTRVRQRAERLARFGPECARWLRLLRPVLDGFVRCFRDPAGQAARSFWQAVCDEHVPNGSGATTYSGWVTAFCFWDEAGRCLHGEEKKKKGGGGGEAGAGADGSDVEPVRLTRSQLPIGFTKVPVTLLDDGLAIPAEMVAGSVAMRASASGPVGSSLRGGGDLPSSGRPVIDTIQPEVGWFMYKT
ncbi:hypothetical protein SLS62_006428 [Diatrype stigma]|uniref:Uncharacterized protein n=1 Tax=Diatrype stigma TaxID=117547 RepID=A0AAN9UPS4_9PEZI